ncbi:MULTISPECIES: tricarballylate/proton symporter TcuC [unclassified Pseudomonas]|uniref:tricarballylate/proton symporter TcuC n=1 Tax=unclassified Pseudomonas TaxID=196821 RepID=UPI000D38CB89|nr:MULTISPECIES: tricarballylate/proton symporter TcuC [unclassified Pseudomonas]RAU47935.1 MFS transporter [Pseudomonas sp. RIT 409]RAU55371.1 MFS transporter [Pseudomonas sp. RIT 412]
MSSRRDTVSTIVRVCVGNCLEVYDLLIFGYFATEIAKAYFPSDNTYASLLATLATFGAGYLMRPIGAFVLGAYIDRVGRRRGLMVTLSMMAVGTLTIAVTPSYESIGILSPIIVVIGRLVQGFSAGAEQGGVSVYLAEIAPPGRKGFFVSWQSASTQLSAVLASSLSVLLTTVMAPDLLSAWGWRIPLLVGCLLIPVLFVLRRSLEETSAFEARRRSTTAELFTSLAANWPVVLMGALVAMMTTVSFYTLNGYTPTFGREVLHLTRFESLAVTFFVACANFVWLPLGGAVSDRLGRLPVLLTCTLLAVLTAYPAMTWLAAGPSFEKLLIVELWLSVLYGLFNGAMIVYVIEIVPESLRTLGFSVAYSLAAIVGGFTPAIDTWLIHETGNRGMPGAWTGAAGLMAFTATLALRHYMKTKRGHAVMGGRLAAATSAVTTRK